MTSLWKRHTAARSRRLALELFEDRIVLAGSPAGPPPPPPSPPVAVDDQASIQILLPSTPVNVLGNDTDSNAGATWDFSSLTVVHQPQFGALTLDATSGQFLYTPSGFNPPPPPGSPPPLVQQDSFTYHVKDSLGLQSNDATVTLFPIGSPKEGVIVSFPDIGFTQSLQPVVINLIANDEIHSTNRHIDPSSVGFSDFPVFPASRLPQHGTVTFNPATGAANYTPDFGYVGWDSFSYQVSTTAGAPDDVAPGVIYTSNDVVFVVVSAAPPRLQADPNGGQMLVVDGTQNADSIQIVPGNGCGQVKAIVNGVSSPSFQPTSRIVVFGYGGDDTITVSPSVRNTTWLVGGSGNDLLKAGGGPSLLMGGDGNDTLQGGYSRDVLIGGNGADSLSSGYASDILVGGSTSFDSQPAALGDILSRWVWGGWNSSNYGFWGRTSYCGSAGNRGVLTSADVLDDGAVDTLNVRSGADLIFATATGVIDNVLDPWASYYGGRSSFGCAARW
jgi:hypothetical protein